MNNDYVKKLFNLDGRYAVVTGAGSGIGQATAIALAQFGAEVIIIGRTKSKLEDTKSIVEKQGGICHIEVMDISDTDAQNEFFSNYTTKYGSLDIFIANAGINIRAELPDVELEDMKKILSIDYVGTLFGLICASNIMKKQHSGNIVVITSVNGLNPLPNQSIYSSIKAALESASKSLASSMAEYGVRVNSIAPGCVYSDGNKHIFCHDEFRKAKESSIPLGFIGAPEDIGNVVAMIAGDACRFMTGATILVDGGEFIRPKQKQPKNDKH